MFGECHAHMIMDSLSYRHAVELHRTKVQDSVIREHFSAYERRGITFVRDGGDALGVSRRAKDLAGEYGIDYRTPVFAIHKKGYYGSIVGLEFTDMKEYHGRVKLARDKGCDFIKIMTTGIMDFDHAGRLSCPSLPSEDVKEMIHIAHEEGLAVMSHTNGSEGVRTAAKWGVDSIEHGNFPDREGLEIMAEHQILYVPTIATVSNLLDCNRYPRKELQLIIDCAERTLRTAWELKVPVALGSDAGAYLVPHGQGVLDEYRIFQRILGEEEGLSQWLEEGEALVKERFKRG